MNAHAARSVVVVLASLVVALVGTGCSSTDRVNLGRDEADAPAGDTNDVDADDALPTPEDAVAESDASP